MTDWHGRTDLLTPSNGRFNDIVVAIQSTDYGILRIDEDVFLKFVALSESDESNKNGARRIYMHLK